nr:MAG TPA: hypothetical protein [Caudoviricetes sp.]
MKYNILTRGTEGAVGWLLNFTKGADANGYIF